ncbi:hypothetical protein Hamer_G006929 [Homarus americanus]|uniref:Uncharacterized protein n=1 Tax=Homarus americanus TaxID=6706 RepID=A0A8J5N405_HOMAM|nr:hypothetical protein Hamer_G006929 [Homarus americanus]
MAEEWGWGVLEGGMMTGRNGVCWRNGDVRGRMGCVGGMGVCCLREDDDEWGVCCLRRDDDREEWGWVCWRDGDVRGREIVTTDGKMILLGRYDDDVREENDTGKGG